MARRLLYAADMNRVQEALRANNVGLARQLLDRHRPKDGELDLRRWEWRYLYQECRSGAQAMLTKREGVPVFSASYSPDGTLLLAGYSDGQVELWNVAARKLQKLIQSPFGQRAHAAFSPRGENFAATMGPGVVKWSMPIMANDAGDPVAGIPNSATEDSVPLADAAGTPIPYNPNGMDVEDIHTLRCGGFIVVDEYSPSVVIVNGHGKVTRRYTPQGKTLAGASYPVSDTLPAILSQRRVNRGFEAVAVSPDGRTAYTVTQSPLGSTASGAPTRDSRVVRLLRMDITDPLNMQVTGQFIVMMSPVSTYPAGNTQRALKISAVTWVNEDKLLFLERSDELLSGVNIGGAKLILEDITSATNIHGTALAATLTPEAVTTDLAALGIATATSTVVYSNEQTPELTDFKLEGLAILNPDKVAISNDNDFGIGDFPGATPKVWFIRLAENLPVGHCW